MVQYRTGRQSPWMVQWRENNGVKTRSFRLKEDAQLFESSRARNRQLVRAGIEAPDEYLLFCDAVQKFIKRRYKNPSLAHSTVTQDDSRMRNFWLVHFGARPVSSIQTQEIKDKLDELQFDLGHSPADRNRHRALLHTFFREQMLDGKILNNPVSRILLVKEISTRKRVYLKTEKEIEIYLSALRQEGEQYWILGEIMAFTGCRICEAIGLQYGDVDEKLGLIRFRRIEERAGGSKIVERTKGRGATTDDDDAHTVPLFPRLQNSIRAYQTSSKHRRPSDFIANTEAGGYVPYDSFKDAHKRAVKNAELISITPHSIRRSFATAAKRAGYTRAEIRELLGHSSEQVTGRYDMREIEHLISKGKKLGFGVKKALRRVK